MVARLASAGYEAHVERERLAGEDDDEDHPWAVLTDAPELVLELLVDEYDGWLDVPEEPPAHPAARPPDGSRGRSSAPPDVVVEDGPVVRPSTLGFPHDLLTSASCSSTRTPTTSASATAPRWRSTSRRAATSRW